MFNPNSVFTSALTESELTAINTTMSFWNSAIVSDDYYGSVINTFNYKGVGISKNIYSSNFIYQSKNLVLIRTQMMTEPIDLSSAL